MTCFHEFLLKHHTISMITTFNNLETHKELFKQLVTFVRTLSNELLHCTVNSFTITVKFINVTLDIS